MFEGPARKFRWRVRRLCYAGLSPASPKNGRTFIGGTCALAYFFEKHDALRLLSIVLSAPVVSSPRHGSFGPESFPRVPFHLLVGQRTACRAGNPALSSHGGSRLSFSSSGVAFAPRKIVRPTRSTGGSAATFVGGIAILPPAWSESATRLQQSARQAFGPVRGLCVDDRRDHFVCRIAIFFGRPKSRGVCVTPESYSISQLTFRRGWTSFRSMAQMAWSLTYSLCSRLFVTKRHAENALFLVLSPWYRSLRWPKRLMASPLCHAVLRTHSIRASQKRRILSKDGAPPPRTANSLNFYLNRNFSRDQTAWCVRAGCRITTEIPNTFRHRSMGRSESIYLIIEQDRSRIGAD